VGQLSTDFRELQEEVSTLKMQIAQKQSDPVVEQLSADFRELQKEVSTLKERIPEMQSTITRSNNQLSYLSSVVRPLSQQPSVGSLDSQIILEFPEIFAEFRGKRFSLLLRKSRDGYSNSEFHRRCDGHANTLIVYLDTNGNIFGAFTPVEWESPTNAKYKADDSLKSFIFTLKNPHNIPARKWKLLAEMKQYAIMCGSGYGPCFGYDGPGKVVYEDCNGIITGYTSPDDIPTDDTEQDKRGILTGSKYFGVKEMEIFEITA
jgi:hypothetical protein